MKDYKVSTDTENKSDSFCLTPGTSYSPENYVGGRDGQKHVVWSSGQVRIWDINTGLPLVFHVQSSEVNSKNQPRMEWATNLLPGQRPY